MISSTYARCPHCKWSQRKFEEKLDKSSINPIGTEIVIVCENCGQKFLCKITRVKYYFETEKWEEK